MIKKIALSLCLAITVLLNAQTTNFKTYPNDPFKLKEYKLKNGLTVFMSVYKDAPRFYSMIATKAGSKNDPKDATGLAHYLEHMLFKGTDKLGTKDFTKEEPLVNAISDLYEVYRKTTDEAKRKAIYHKIDSLSGEAAKFAIANEYDKLCSAMGCKGTNAFTSNEQTVYVNDVPSNQMDNWLSLEAERYRKLVLRLFHTELEAVYEEKNRGLDNDQSKVFEAYFAGMFKNHQYGTQTTIGTIEHLKNPSMVEIMKYFHTYYVPNNMAIILAGDFDPDKTAKLIEEKFSYMKEKPVPTFTFVTEAPITAPVEKHVYGPDAENVLYGYRFGGINSTDADMIKLIALILSNQKAGLFDINLNQEQKVLNAAAFDYPLKDYSTLGLIGKAKEGQSLEEVVKLMNKQIENIKQGKFDDWLITANIANLKLNLTKNLETNESRAFEIEGAFTSGESWEHHIELIDRLSKITKQQIIDFAKKNLNTNYVIVYKHTGEDKNVQKVIKPAITPVSVNREDQSPFLKALMANKPAEIAPVFLNFDKDITKTNLKNGTTVLHAANIENATFEMYYTFNMGSNNNKLLPIAIEYAKYIGTDKYNAAKLQEEFYKLACSFDAFSTEDQTALTLTGLSDNFGKAIDLLEQFLTNAKPDQQALDNLINDLIKQRNDAKLSKRTILQKGLVNYGAYGANNPFTNVLSDEELKKLKAEDLTKVFTGISKYGHHVLYYGPLKLNELTNVLETKHYNKTIVKPEAPLANILIEQKTGNQVYVVDYDMKQAELVMLGKGEPFTDKIIPQARMYNEYFGGNMSAILFQELRESKALAYSVSGSYRIPAKKEKSFYLSTYIGSQADKLGEALQGMTDLIKDLPSSEVTFNSAKDAVISGIRNERLTKIQLLLTYEGALKQGLNYDIRKPIFEQVEKMTFNDVKQFQLTYVKNTPLTLLVVGKKDLLDMKILEKYGQVKYLTLKEVFGY
ncbi:MAG TPA: insulinase family protein [Bacteroidia bacterium]|jgi:predicted Zn-dependent peptidase|nr:insulinase family protein [Bacteroidia bacterium]